MARLSMNEVTTYRWTFEEDVRWYEAKGLEGIGVWRQKLSDFGEEKGVELLAESRLRASCLLWAGGFTGSDGRSLRDSVDDGLEAIRLARALEAEVLILYSGPRHGHTQNHARRLFRGALDQLIPLASDLGVTLAIEPMHPGCAAEWTFLTDLDETLSLIRAIDCPHVRIVYDSYHFGLEPLVTQRLGDLAPLIAMVQLGDAKAPPQGEQNRCPLGDGILPLAEIVGRLLDAGYDGYFDVELLGEDVEDADYGQLIERSCQAFSRLTQSVSP